LIEALCGDPFSCARRLQARFLFSPRMNSAKRRGNRLPRKKYCRWQASFAVARKRGSARLQNRTNTSPRSPFLCGEKSANPASVIGAAVSGPSNATTGKPQAIPAIALPRRVENMPAYKEQNIGIGETALHVPRRQHAQHVEFNRTVAKTFPQLRLGALRIAAQNNQPQIPDARKRQIEQPRRYFRFPFDPIPLP